MLKNKQRNIRNDYINKLVYLLTAKTKPSVITIENLDVSEMIKHNGTKDATLHKYISESSFYTFKVKLTNKCKYYGIRLREANKYFASSKICSRCGNKNKSLTLSDRVYYCNKCGLTIDRDINASINLLTLEDNKCEIIA
jgi:putative transposase